MKTIHTTLFVLLLLAGSGFAQTVTPLVPYRVGNMWGLADTSGNLKVAATYKNISRFVSVYGKGTAYVVKKNTAEYVIDATQKVLVPETLAYDSIIPVSYIHGDYQVFKAGKAGYYRGTKQAVPCIYQEVYATSNSSYVVVKDNLKGLVDMYGKIVIPIKYQQIWPSFGRTSKDTFFWTAKGLLAEETFTSKRVPSIDDEEVVLMEDSGPGGRGVNPEDRQKIQELKSSYDKVETAGYFNGAWIVYIEKGGLKGLYSLKEDRELFTPRYHSLKWVERIAGRALVIAEENGLFGLINEKGETILPVAYKEIEENRGWFRLKKNGKYGFYLYTNGQLTEPAYDHIESKEVLYFSRGSFWLFLVTSAGKRGYIGENGVVFFREE